MRVLLILAFVVSALAQGLPFPTGIVATGGGTIPYSYCKVITTSSTMVGGSSDLTSYPLTVILTDTDLKVVGSGGLVNNSSGFDIGFYPDCSGHGTALKWEMESYAPTTGAIVAHVLRPTLSHTTDDTIGMVYGGSQATFQSTVSAVWNSSFQGVWHLSDVQSGASSVLDSTGNANNGTPSGSPGNTTGIVNGGGLFTSAGSKYVDVGSGSSLNLTSAVTVEAWIITTTTGSNGRVYSKLSGTPYAGVELIRSLDFVFLQVGNGTGSGGTDGSGLSSAESAHVLMSSTPYHVAATYDSATGTANMYLNGSLSGTPVTFGSSAIGTTGQNANISRYPGGSSSYWDGVIDEVRVSSVALSADWILTEYRNQFSPGSYISVGSRIVL